MFTCDSHSLAKDTLYKELKSQTNLPDSSQDRWKEKVCM